MQENKINPDNFEQCLKCNICISVCPMLAVNPHYPGPKQAGPDGERYRLKDPSFYDLTLKYCLNCKRCEVACPSGVRVGDIIQISRLKYGRQNRPLRDSILADTDLSGSLVTPVAPVANAALKFKPVRKIMDAFGVDERRTLPEYSSRKFESWFRKEALSLQSAFERKIAYFHGCYVNYNFPQLGKDFVKLMNAVGYGVELLDKEKCCGVALISNGMGSKAVRNASANVRAVRKSGRDVLTTSSTCTFTIRDEYANVLGMDCADMSERVFLATKWLFDRIEDGRIKLAFRPDFRLKAVYHTACHMQKLGWAIYSVSLLKMIPGLELTVLEQQCCGIAGTFGFKKENYDYSQAIGEKLFGSIKAAGPEAAVTDCETCKWQIEMGTGLKVLNPVSVLADALDIEKTRALNER